MYQSSAVIPTLNQGPNLAPQIKQDQADTAQSSKPFNEWVKTTTDKLERQSLEIWRELHLVWMLICLFIEGKHMLRKRHRGFGFDVVPLPGSTAASVREQNKLGFYSRALSSKWVSSRTKVEAVAGDDTEESQAAARMAEAFLEAIQEMIYSERFRQTEAIGGQICGSYARYFCYDDNADGGFANDAIIEQQQVKFGDDTGQCLECEYSGPGAEFGASSDRIPAMDESPDAGLLPPSTLGSEADLGQAVLCPNCGSNLVQIDEMPAANVSNVVGYQKRKLGNLRGETVPYTRLRHEIATTLEDSPWMRWKQRLRIEQIKQQFPSVKIAPYDNQMRDSGLEVEDALQRTIGGYQNTAMLGYWSKDRDQYGEITHWWLTPAMYHDYVFPMDTELNEIDPATGEAITIPAGTKAIDLFPDGMHFVMVSGNDQPLMLENDCHTDHWVTAPYHLRFLAGIGLGINDAVEMQRQWNVILGLVFTHIRTAALPGWLYDKDTISPDEVRKLGQPQMSIPASLRNKPENTRLEQLVYQMAPGQIPSHIPWYLQQLDTNMQTISGVLEFSGGLPGVDNKTATGAQIGASMAQSHNSPEFALKGDADVRSAYILVELAKKHMPEERFYALQGKWGHYDTIQFSGADLEAGEIRLQAKRDSWLPNTRFAKQESIEKVLQITGGIQGLMLLQDAAPDLLDQLEEAYDVTIHGDTYSANVILCRQRIDQIKQQLPMFEQMAAGGMLGMAPLETAAGTIMAPMVDPMTGMPVDPQMMLAEEVVNILRPPIEPEEPGHLLSIKFLREFLITDEGKEASDMERACYKAMIRRHIQSQILESQITAQAQMAAMPTPPMGAEEETAGSPEKSESDKRKDSARANMKAPRLNAMPAMAGQGAMQMPAMGV